MSTDIELMQHALGISERNRQPYRNYFLTDCGGADGKRWQQLVARGLATARPAPDFTCGDTIYEVTDAGSEMALAVLPEPKKLTRYDEYLHSEVCESFGEWLGIPALPEGPERWSCNSRAHTRHGVNLFPTDVSGTFNSGQRAILFAHWLGAKRIILLGFDCSISDGSHWHGDHTVLDNPTAANVKRWHSEFVRVAAQLRGSVNIINSSRQTALNCFRRLPLEAAIREVTC